MRRFLLTALVLPAFAAPIPAPPGPGGVLSGLSIASFGGSGQNLIKATAVDSNGNIYVAGTASSADFPVKNAIQPKFGEARILRTNDLGTTWARVGNPPDDVKAVVPDPAATQILFAQGIAGIYKSIDGGESWRLVYAFQPSSSFTGNLVIDPGNDMRLAAITANGPIRSLDGGETWTATACACFGRLSVDPTGAGTLLLDTLQELVPTQPRGIQISRDWGLTFQPLSPPGLGTPAIAAFDPSHPGWIYADNIYGYEGTLSLSMNFGSTWTMKASPASYTSAMISLQIDPSQPNTLLAATWDGLYKSSDGAASWQLQPRASSSQTSLQPYLNMPFAMPAHCGAPGALFAVGLYNFSVHAAFSPDYGMTWTAAPLTAVTSVAAGPGCAVYITREPTWDAFVAKLAPDGTTLWATFLGGSDQDSPVALVLDAQGNAYVTGNTHSPDFPSSVPRIGVPGISSVFVTKFLPDGNRGYSVTLGGESTDLASAIAADSGGNIYVSGSTNSAKFPVTPGSLLSALSSGPYTGFLVKLSSGAALVAGTYLGGWRHAVHVDAANEVIVAGSGQAPGLSAPAAGSTPDFVMKLDETASRVISAAYIDEGYGFGAASLATDPAGNLIVAGGTYDNIAVTPGAYAAPPSESASGCVEPLWFDPHRAYIVKLAASDWRPIYRSLLSAPCAIQLGAMAVDSTGAVVLALATGGGLPLSNPLLGAPSCSGYSSGVAKLSPDGSQLQFATYLDNCGVPGMALANDGSIYLGVSSRIYGGAAGVLHLSGLGSASFSINLISNAFSGDAEGVTPGGLYALAVSGLQPPSIDLGINPSQDLPTQLGGVQVTFDGIPAAILRTSPERVIVASPANLPVSMQSVAFTSVQVFYNGVPSKAVWMTAYPSAPGLLTRDLLDPIYRSAYPDGEIRNEDGTLNGADHPAAAGSTITLLVTGMGATNPPVNPGSVAKTASVAPVIPLYSSWTTSPFDPVAETVYSVPGLISAVFQINLRVPNSIQHLGDDVGNGVQRAPVWLVYLVTASDYPPASNIVGVYVK